MFKTHRYLPALLIVVGVAAAAPACAAQTYGYGYPRTNGGYGRDIERRAYDNGYRQGLEEGRNDARRNRHFSPEQHGEYRDADNGYHRGEGDINFYRRSYRQGFETGYRESFDRIARSSGGYGNRGDVYNAPVYQDPRIVNPRGGYANIAAQNGYRDGFEAGRNDARDRARVDPVRAKRYREGDHDYNGRYGDRDTYKREFRAAFEQGYREGYGQTR